MVALDYENENEEDFEVEGRCSGSLGQGHGIEIPGGVGQPLFAPAPVLVLAGHGEANVEIDAVQVGTAAGDAVADAARGIVVFVGLKVHVKDIVPSGTLQHAAVIGVQSENPV